MAPAARKNLRERGIDALYRLSPGEFTAARNTLAQACLRKGESEQAERIRRLARPKITAWAANRLYWDDRRRFARWARLGRRLFELQAAGPRVDADKLRAVVERRRALLEELSVEAAALMRSAGHAPTRPMLRRVETNLQALALADPSGEIVPGRLAFDLELPGFEPLLAAPTGRKASSPRRGRAELRGIDQARRALAEAEARTRQRQAQLEHAAVALKTAQDELSRARDAELEVARRQRLARRKTAGARQALRRSERAARRAQASLSRAERAEASARQRVEQARGT